jgi:hypothetical protein
MNRISLSELILILTMLLSAGSFGIPVNGQENSDSLYSHYLLPDFVKGSVKMKNGKTETAIMDYNMLSEEMIFEKEGSKLAIKNVEAIDTVYLGSRIFIPHEKIFFEILINDKVTLFIQHKCKLLLPGNSDGYGVTSETSATTSISVLISSGNLYKLKLPEEYRLRDASQFWITGDKSIYRITSERQILKLFPEKSLEIKQFIKQKKLNLRKQEDMAVLITRCNELLR